MSLHSTNHWGGGPQHPDKNPLHMNADLTRDHLIAGFEWNKRDDVGQLDLTWWFTWFDQGSQSWMSDHTTKALTRDWVCWRRPEAWGGRFQKLAECPDHQPSKLIGPTSSPHPPWGWSPGPSRPPQLD